MELNNLIDADNIYLDIDISSRKRILEFIAQLGEQKTRISQQTFFEQLIERERLGSTAIGNGVALPNCLVEDNFPKQLFILSTKEMIDFNASDQHPVDLFFALLLPKENHEQKHYGELLATLSKLLSDKVLVKSLKGATEVNQVIELLKNTSMEVAI